jgi:hypothetical protein
MKTFLVLVPVFVLAGLAAHGQAPRVPTPAPKPKSAYELYQEGQAAFFREDFVTAKAKLAQVLRLSPRHQPTIIMLKNIELAEAAAAAKNATLEGRAQRIVFPTLDLVDAKVPEILDFLQTKSGEVAGADGRPNFIVKLDPAAEKQTITLKLSKVTLYDALRAVADAANLEVAYDRHAIIIKSRGIDPPPAAPEPKTPGAGQRK